MTTRAQLEKEIIDHLVLNDFKDCFNRLFSLADAHDVMGVLIELLRKTSYVPSVCAFTRDLISLPSAKGEAKRFQAIYEGSKLSKELERLVLHGNYGERRDAIYTLGKTGHSKSLPQLKHAIAHWEVSDPLLLPPLVAEFQCLGGDAFEIIEKLLESEQFLTRWAAVTLLDQPKNKALRRKHLNRLKGDSSKWVSSEAQRLGKIEDIREVANSDYVSFDDLIVWFGNYLHQTNRADYQVSELEEFIQNTIPGLLLKRKAHFQR